MDEWKQNMMTGYNNLDNSFEKEEYMYADRDGFRSKYSVRTTF